jgi:cation transport ATPase
MQCTKVIANHDREKVQIGRRISTSLRYTGMTSQPTTRPERSRFKDRLMLLGAAFLVCVIGLTVFATAEAYHINSDWVLVAFIGISFFAMAAWDYRQKLRSPAFVLYLLAWAAVYALVFLVVMSLWGWFYWLSAMCVELFLFGGITKLLFGLDPPSPNKHRRSLDEP